MEPVKGLLTRYLRRRQIEGEIQRGSRYPMEVVKILDWLPKVWFHLNKVRNAYLILHYLRF